MAAVGGTIVAGYRNVTTAMLPVTAVVTRRKDIERTQTLYISPDDIGFVSLPAILFTRLITGCYGETQSQRQYNGIHMVETKWTQSWPMGDVRASDGRCR